MSEPKMIRTSQIALLGGVSALVGGGIIALVLIIVPKHEVVKLPLPVGGGNPSSPIKVRGGAMTFRSKKKWYPSGAASEYCSSISDVSTLELDDVVGVPPPSPVPSSFSPLSADWTLMFYGHGNSGNDGIKVSAKIAGTCNGVNGPTIVIDPITQTSAFYSEDYIDDDNNTTHSKRFEDNYTYTTYVNGKKIVNTPCLGPGNGSTGDEDACERIKTVQLTLNPPDEAAQTTYNYTCPNGECVVKIGKPQ